MGATVKELLNDAITNDLSHLAHTIYYAVEQGIVKLEDSKENIPYDKLDYDVIIKMRKENILSVCDVKLYVVPMGNKRFAVYLARNEAGVYQIHNQRYGVQPAKVMDVSFKIDMTIYCQDTGKEESFWEIKNRVLHFPYFVGEMMS